MKAYYGKVLFALMIVLTPFFAQAQISGSSSVCEGSTISMSDSNPGGIWASGNNAVATVDGSGNVTGVSYGQVVISYSYVNISFALVIDTMSITVLPTNAGVVSAFGINYACPGGGAVYSDYVSYLPGGAWSSADTSIATVDAFGIVTAGSTAGVTTISYTVNNGCVFATATLSFTALPATNAGTISGNASVCPGSLTTLSDAVAGGAWSSSDNTLATVDGSGDVTGVAAGNPTITYTVSGFCGVASAILNITVNSLPDNITTGAGYVCALSTINFNDDSAGGTWTSANNSIATVNSNGVVFGVNNGTTPNSTTITYTLPTGCYITTGILVDPLPYAGAIGGSLNVSNGGQVALNDNSGNYPGVWSSCNNLIASVNGSGGLNGIANGTTVVSYTVSGNCGTAFTTATVIVGSCTTATGISTFAGDHVAGYTGDGGYATAADMGSSFGVVADGNGNVYVSDYFNNVVREINHSGIITTIAGIAGGGGYNGDNIQATSALLSGPMGLTLDGLGNLYIADKLNERIRVVNLNNGVITTIAGNGLHGGWNGAGFGYGGPATLASLDYPVSVALDCSGNIYISDQGSETVRKIDPSGNIWNFAGNHAGGYSGDGGPATSAQLNNPSGITADCAGNVYIADAWNNRIRVVNAEGNISTIAGTGVAGYSGDGGPDGNAQLWIPTGVTLDACGGLYVADWQNNVIRYITPMDEGHDISTFAGLNANDWHGYDGDGGPADSAYLYLPSSVAIDGIGNVYIADYGNNVIRAVGNSLPPERRFNNGTTQDMTVSENATVSINNQMAIPETTSGMAETWSVSINPAHGTLSGFSTTATARETTTTPTGLTYTPADGYTGMDAFTVVMNDGTTSASTTVNVNVVKDNALAPGSKTLLFPNPNNGNFQYAFTSQTDCQLQMNVLDVTGRIVYTQAVTATAGANVVSINLPSNIESPALYTVALGNKNVKYPAAKITVTQ